MLFLFPYFTLYLFFYFFLFLLFTLYPSFKLMPFILQTYRKPIRSHIPTQNALQSILHTSLISLPYFYQNALQSITDPLESIYAFYIIFLLSFPFSYHSLFLFPVSFIYLLFISFAIRTEYLNFINS